MEPLLIKDKECVFILVDRGQTWRNINKLHTLLGSKPNVLEASKQKFWVGFVGTDGRGIYY
jgi:hypothetical protein